MQGPAMWGAVGVSHWSTNTYFDGTNYKHIATGAVQDYYQLNGAHVLRASDSGAAGANVTTFANLIAVTKGQSLALQGASSQTGTGISFPATQNASTDANTLDDYEEGTWTPTLTSTAGSFTAASATGTYTKIGRAVTVNIRATITTNGTASGAILVGNFPFAAVTASAISAVGREDSATGALVAGGSSNTTTLYLAAAVGNIFVNGSTFSLCTTYNAA
jgi:hypothetical protein